MVKNRAHQNNRDQKMTKVSLLWLKCSNYSNEK